ncbi:MAG: DUF2938 family protein [Rhodospirillaceae bacterium]|jgi:hypothetical protein|nr:DUF2938 family protein [Rhodospirillaceae bacterium]MBT7953559.1 DUF2938 family protein [Rhodospirillaceae bacterium]
MLWFWSFIGGLVGTVFMDFAVSLLRRAGISSGLEGLLGRWVIGFGFGRFVIDGHQERLTPPTDIEIFVGKWFHFVIGGGVVALGYPLWFAVSGQALPVSPLFGGIIYGIATLPLAWFVQYPPFGFGICGRKAPASAQPIFATVPMHLAYGLGLGLVLQFAPL